MNIKTIKTIDYTDGITQDHVSVDWFDLQKKHLTLTTDAGQTVILKAMPDHWHERPVFVCDDGYRIAVTIRPQALIKLQFSDALTFAKIAYAVGNVHQPIALSDLQIIVLDDSALSDVIHQVEHDDSVTITRFDGVFTPNGRSSHSH